MHSKWKVKHNQSINMLMRMVLSMDGDSMEKGIGFKIDGISYDVYSTLGDLFHVRDLMQFVRETELYCCTPFITQKVSFSLLSLPLSLFSSLAPNRRFFFWLFLKANPRHMYSIRIRLHAFELIKFFNFCGWLFFVWVGEKASLPYDHCH